MSYSGVITTWLVILRDTGGLLSRLPGVNDPYVDVQIERDAAEEVNTLDSGFDAVLAVRGAELCGGFAARSRNVSEEVLIRIFARYDVAYRFGILLCPPTQSRYILCPARNPVFLLYPP